MSVDQVEAMVDGIDHAIRKKYDQEMHAKVIGEMVMDRLAVLDEVAYVRFASIYRQFRDVNQFMDELQTILGKNKAKNRKLKARKKGRHGQG